MSKLEAFIESLEYGRNIRISVVPIGRIPVSDEIFVSSGRIIHSHKYCSLVKALSRLDLRRCMVCKALAINKAVREGTLFAGKCIQNICEAVCPVVIDGKTEYVVFVGGITVDNIIKNIPGISSSDLEYASDLQPYREMAAVVADYIKTIAKAYPYTGEKKYASQIEKTLLEYADTYYTNSIALGDLAKMFYMNEKYLGRVFKKRTGLAFHEYINKKRLDKAAYMLINDEIPIIEIAMECGFNSLTYFYRLFGRVYGVSPYVYRKTGKEN